MALGVKGVPELVAAIAALGKLAIRVAIALLRRRLRKKGASRKQRRGSSRKKRSRAQT